MIDIDRLTFNIIKERKRVAEDKRDAILFTLRKDEEFSDVESEIRYLEFKSAGLDSQSSEKKQLISRLEELRGRFQNILFRLGKKEKDITPDYFCNICKDTGVAKGERCLCAKKVSFDLLREMSNVPKAEANNFKALGVEKIDEDKKEKYTKIYKYLEGYAKDFPKSAQIMILTGPVGSGKTMAAAIVSEMLMKRNKSVIMMNAQKLNTLFLEYHLAPLEKKDDLFLPLKNADLLIIDDLGTECKLKNVTDNYLYSIISERQDKHILITTNVREDELEDLYGQRIFSRLMDRKRAVYILMDNSDIRLNS